jgi:hypothetical protein
MYYKYIPFNVSINCLIDISIKKKELPLVCGGVFVYSGRLGVTYDSQVTNRSATGEEGLSQGIILASF